MNTNEYSLTIFQFHLILSQIEFSTAAKEEEEEEVKKKKSSSKHNTC